MTHAEAAVAALRSAMDPELKATQDKLIDVRVFARDLLFAIEEGKQDAILAAAADLAPLVNYTPASFSREDV